MALIRDPSDPSKILKINSDGSINVVATITEVEVKNDSGSPLTVTDSGIGTDGNGSPSIAGTGVRGWLRAIYEKLIGTLSVSGTVSVGNFPATQTVSGSVSASVTGTVTAIDGGGSLTVDDGGGSLTVDGSVSISGTAAVSGTVTANLAAGSNTIGNIGSVASITNPVSVTDNGGSLTVDGTLTVNQGTGGASAWPVSGPLTDTQLRASAVPVSVGNFPATQNVALTGTGTAAATPVFDSPVIAGAVVSEANPIPTRNVPANLAVQSQSAAAAASTLTLPAPGPGLFHYIDAIEIHVYATAARTGAAAPVTVTSTNLPGALSWLFPTGQAIGTIDRYAFSGDRPMKSVAANTATTIVAPAVTGAIVQMKAVYSVGP